MIADPARASRPVPRIVAIVVLMAAIAALPATAAANAGTPLILLTPIHMFFGNAIIGIVEGLTIAWLWGSSNARAILLMVVANYISAFAFALLIDLILYEPTIHTAFPFFIGLFILSYLATLLIELPLAYLALERPASRFGPFLGVHVIAQTATYIVIAFLYLAASRITLASETNHDPSLSFLKPFDGFLYYIDDAEGQLRRMDLADRSRVALVRELGSRNLADRAFVFRNSAEEPWSLGVLCNDTRQKKNRVDLGPLCDESVITHRHGWGRGGPLAFLPLADVEGSWMNFGSVDRVPSAGTPNLSIRTGYWPIEGIRIWQENDSSPHRWFAMEAPGLMWPIRNATLLPDDIVIFQLGTDQIVALDLKTDTVGLLARGRGPLVTERVAASGS